MKQTWQCPKCGSRRVGYLEKVLDMDGGMATRRVAHSPSRWGWNKEGETEAFVCTSCGYFEEYIKNPGAINWDAVVGFRWCNHQ